MSLGIEAEAGCRPRLVEKQRVLSAEWAESPSPWGIRGSTAKLETSSSGGAFFLVGCVVSGPFVMRQDIELVSGPKLPWQ